MNLVSRVSLMALGPLVSTACRAVGLSVAAEGASSVARFLTDRLTDQSLRVTDALGRASEQAWRTLELALAGESLLTAVDRADDRAFREQVRLYLLRVGDDHFAARCLGELRAARAIGLLGGAADPVALTSRLDNLTRFSDPAAIVAAQWSIADEMSADLKASGFGTLAAFLTLRPGGEPTAEPLLAVAVSYHFRRAVEEDPKLFQGLTFAQLERIGRAQEDGSTVLANVLARINALHTAVTDQSLPLAEEIAEPLSVADRFRDQTNGVLVVSPDGTRVLGGSQYDGKLRLFDARTGKELRRLAGHAGWVACVAFSADGARALSGGEEGTVKLWDVASGKLLRTWPAAGAKPVAVAFTAEGRARAEDATGTVRVWTT